MRRHGWLSLLLARLAAAPNTYHETSAIWSHTKRCDMLEHATELNVQKGYFTTMHGGWQYPYPAYTAGSWIPSTPHQPSVTGYVPLACDAASMCPNGSPGCEGMLQSKSVCARFHTSCYADRRSPTFQQNIGTLRYTWQPSNGCRFSPAAPVAEWYEWAKAREADAGSMLFVGDSTLASLFVAFQQLTSGAASSE